MSGTRAALAPSNPKPWFRKFFGSYCERLFKKKFAAVRLAHGSGDVLESMRDETRPIILAMNHASWWDPLTGMLLSRRFFPDRATATPIEMEQFEKFRFFSMLGVFGLDTSSGEAPEAFQRFVAERFERDERATLILTPQGTFADHRDPVRIRPGVAAVASKHPEARVIVLSAEYGFWEDQRPEIFMRAIELDAPQTPSTTGWVRAITRGMRDNADALASLVRAREPEAFTDLLGRSGSKVHPVYDLILRLRGKDASVRARRDRDGRLA